jgi:hypothetical protein
VNEAGMGRIAERIVILDTEYLLDKNYIYYFEAE